MEYVPYISIFKILNLVQGKIPEFLESVDLSPLGKEFMPLHTMAEDQDHHDQPQRELPRGMLKCVMWLALVFRRIYCPVLWFFVLNFPQLRFSTSEMIHW